MPTYYIKNPKIVKILGYMFSIFGIIMFIVTGFLYFNTKNFIKKSIAVEGTIKDLVSSDSNENTYYHPIFTFNTVNGETIEIKSNVGSSRPTYSKGDKVLVRYDPKDPYQAKINSFFSLWGISFICGIFALSSFISGFMSLKWGPIDLSKA